MIKAIETEYKGYRFRSRLEARWAVFFDELGLRYEYEPEGFELSDGTWYLPDFRVWTPQNQPIWYEVKPAHIKHDEKLEAFKKSFYGDALNDDDFDALPAEESSIKDAALDEQDDDADYECAPRISLLSGDPLDMLQDAEMCPRCGLISTYVDDCGSHYDSVAKRCLSQVYCYDCDCNDDAWVCETASPEDFDWHEDFIAHNIGVSGMKVWRNQGNLIFAEDEFNAFKKQIECAAKRARQARFEKGNRR